jgi:outer membrane receptor protein involved in Fe transport
MRRSALFSAAFAALTLAVAPSALFAQATTTSSIEAVVREASGTPRPNARVVATHEPSGTRYESRTRGDGRVTIPGLRVGGPYRVVATSIGFQGQAHENVFLTLGQATNLEFTLREAAVQLTEVTVTGEGETIFSSDRTGAATSVGREAIATLPTVNRRIEDFARLTPQYSGTSFGFSFGGQDNRLNNVTVDGSSFNNSFGLAGQPGDRTGVAPISMDAIEQIQIAVAPYDVRQGNFVGAGVNTVTRSGTNDFSGSLYYQYRNEGLQGTKAGDQLFNRGEFDFKNVGGFLGGPILRDRLFFFFSYEDDELTQPGTTFRANTGTEPIEGGVTRVRAADLDQLSTYLATNFDYETGPYQDYSHLTPGKRLLGKLDFNVNDRNKLSVRYNRLDSMTDVLASTSSSLGFGRLRGTNFLNFQNSNYIILENIRSIVGEWNSLIGSNMANNLLIGRTEQDESRASRGTMFPFVDILEGTSTYTSFGFEPFTPNNELRYNSFQLQNNFTRFGERHTWTFGASAEWYESENVFFPGSQSAYVYNSLADFYTDANGYLANPNRTTSPVNLRRFQVRWMNIPDLEKPVQPLEVLFAGLYAQDEWQFNPNLKLTLGLRVDQARFGETAFTNQNADQLNFQDENGYFVRYQTGHLPDAKPLWSPRLGFNWDVHGNRTTQVRGGTGIFTGRPAYVWISNQIGNTGVLTGFEQLDGSPTSPLTTRPFHPDPNHYKPTNVTGAPATSYELALTDPEFQFPQLWRSNIAVDQRLPWGWTGTAEFMYNSDVNGIYYINANLPQANASFLGPDTRPRWATTAGPGVVFARPSCTAATDVPCQNRLNNRAGNRVSNAIVLKNQSEGFSWNAAASVERSFRNGFFTKAAYSYSVSKNTVDPGSIAFGSWNNNQHAGNPNNPGLGYSSFSGGHRLFLAGSYRREYFRFGATTLGLFAEARTLGNASYTFAGDANGDGGTSNDLIYVPRDESEMRFVTYTQAAVGTTVPARTFTAAEQTAAWEAYIRQDEYLNSRRGQYVERSGAFLPLVKRVDLSISQELFTNVVGRRNALSIRADIQNFGNLLNKNWGIGQRFVTTQPLTTPGVNAAGELTYRLRNSIVDGQHTLLAPQTFEPTAGSFDVFRVGIGLRYMFN